MKKEMLILSLLLLSLLSAGSVLALSPCQSGGIATSVNKEYQMAYPDEDFLQVTDIGLIKNVSQLKDLTCLQYMDATDRTIKGDIADLKNLINLEVFSLYSNPEVSGDICALAGAEKLRSLKFAFDPNITGNISCLKGLARLETFAMTHTKIYGDLSVFANMTNLKAIYIGGTDIRGDICALRGLTNLEELGIADEYPGNPGITGDLSCLNNLKNLTKVSLYNTKATNCEQFTEDHPNIEQGGCSRDSMKTLVDYGQAYEKKIGKETQTEVRGQANYQPADTRDAVSAGEEPDKRGFFARLFDWIKNLFKASPKSSGIYGQSKKSGDMDKTRTASGPEGCKTQAECDAACAKPENKEACSKFAPPGEETQPSVDGLTPGAASKPVCRVSVLPSSKGTAPYTARVCVDNPDERIQQDYQDYLDFEGDGSWDEYEDSKHGCHSHNYLAKGTFSPTAKIVDAKGIESDICQTTLTVS